MADCGNKRMWKCLGIAVAALLVTFGAWWTVYVRNADEVKAEAEALVLKIEIDNRAQDAVTALHVRDRLGQIREVADDIVILKTDTAVIKAIVTRIERKLEGGKEPTALADQKPKG